MTRKLPDNVKKLRGTDQPCRMSGETLDFESIEDVPEAPTSLNVQGRDYWERIVPILIKKRVLTIADLESLEILCVLYGKVMQAVSAGVDVNASSVTQLRLYQTEFGLTPASRAKIKAGDDGGKGNKFTQRGKKKT